MGRFVNKERFMLVILAVVVFTSFFALTTMADEPKSDTAMYRQDGAGNFVYWIMDGFDLDEEVELNWGETPSDEIAAVYCQGDGSHIIYWQVTSLDGKNVIPYWEMEGINRVDEGYLTWQEGEDPHDALHWIVAAVADITGNGDADIIFKEEKEEGERNAAYWAMEGFAGQSANYLSWQGNPHDVQDWQVGAVANLDYPGTTEIIWVLPDAGQRAYWKMDETFNAGEAGWLLWQGAQHDVEGWTFGAIYDMDGNGVEEIIWQNPEASEGNEFAAAWIMDGYNGTSAKWIGYEGDPAGATWEIVGVHEYIVEPEPKLEVVSVEAITDTVSVSYGRSEQNAVKSLYDLTEFEGEVDGGDNVSLTVSDWVATDGYDGNEPGSYPFEGQASAPEGYVFAAGVSQIVNATVIVQEFTHPQEVGSIINIDKDDNMIMFRVLDVDSEYYDGSSPGSVQLLERAGAGLTDNDKVTADSITWLSNISEDGEAQIIYNGLKYEGPTNDDNAGTATVTVVIETDDSAVASIFTVELAYSAGQEVWRNADIIDVYGGEPLNPRVESIETITAGARASRTALDNLFSIEAKNNGPSGSKIKFYFALSHTESNTYVYRVDYPGFGVIEIDVVLGTELNPVGALVSKATASDVKAAIEANGITNDLVNVTVNSPNEIVLRQIWSLEGGERAELQVTWNEEVELVQGAALFTLQGIIVTEAIHVFDNPDKITLIWDDVPLLPVSENDLLNLDSGAVKIYGGDLTNLQESWRYEAMNEEWLKE